MLPKREVCNYAKKSDLIIISFLDGSSHSESIDTKIVKSV